MEEGIEEPNESFPAIFFHPFVARIRVRFRNYALTCVMERESSGYISVYMDYPPLYIIRMTELIAKKAGYVSLIPLNEHLDAWELVTFFLCAYAANKYKSIPLGEEIRILFAMAHSAEERQTALRHAMAVFTVMY